MTENTDGLTLPPGLSALLAQRRPPGDRLLDPPTNRIGVSVRGDTGFDLRYTRQTLSGSILWYRQCCLPFRGTYPAVF